MCVSAAMAVGTIATSAYSASQQSKAGAASAAEARIQAQAAMYEGALDEELRRMEARDISESSQNEANAIKRQAMLMRGQMLVSQSGSGIVAGEGSAQAAMDQLDTLSSADALAALFSGVNKSVSVRNQGQMSGQRGSQALIAGNRQASSIQSAANASATGTLLGGAVKAGGILYKG